MKTMRRVGLIVGGCVLASLGLLAGLIAWLGAWTGLLSGLVLVTAVVALYVGVVGPWQRRWGARPEELRRTMPGDDLLRRDAPSTTRAITIDAPPDDVFPWLLQIGYGRGGWYSYDWIDNDGRPSVERLDPALQRLAVGDRIAMVPGMGPTVRWIDPGHAIVSGGDADSWCLTVEPDRGGSRLISRWRQDWPKTPATAVWLALSDPGAFVMEQKMLRTIKRLAERQASTRLAAASPR
jgi:hypothetical protein